MKTRLLLAICVLAVSGAPAFACLGPSLEEHHYPSCAIPMPEPGQSLLVVEDSFWGGEIEVRPNAGEHHLLLNAGRVKAWRFSGDVESLKRVVVLGIRAGKEAEVDISGIPAERLLVVTPKPAALAALDSMRTLSSCARIFRVCDARQELAEIPGQKGAGPRLVKFHPPHPADQPRLTPDFPKERDRSGREIQGPLVIGR